MLKTWLASIIREELDRTETTTAREIARLEKKFAQLIDEMKAHTVEAVKDHAVNVAADLHEKVSADAKAIALFRQTSRMPCSRCGQMAWKYAVDKEAGKIICTDCAAKEEAAR